MLHRLKQIHYLKTGASFLEREDIERILFPQ